MLVQFFSFLSFCSLGAGLVGTWALSFLGLAVQARTAVWISTLLGSATEDWY